MNSSKPGLFTDIVFDTGSIAERTRIINLLLDLNVIRRCAATDKLVAVTTDMEKVVYLTGLEN